MATLLLFPILSVFHVLLTVKSSFSTGVQLSPSNVALVCPGQQLSLTCQANQSSALRWTITPPEGSATYTRDVQTSGNLLSLPVEVAGITVTVYFSRQSVDPLTSTLSINSTSTDLNRTRINCSTGDSSAMTIVYVTEDAAMNFSRALVRVNNVMTHFEITSVTVSLEWTPAEDVVYNSVTVDPRPLDMMSITINTLWNLTLSYNTSYTVKIIATYCGRNITTNLTLEYVPCESIISNMMESIYDPALQVKNMNYMNRPALSGDSITFQCSSGLVLAGPSSSMCTDDGQWIPHPWELKCVNMSDSTEVSPNCSPPSLPPNGYIFPYSSTGTSAGSTVTFMCQISDLAENSTAICISVNWEPNPYTHCINLSQVTESTGNDNVSGAIAGSVLGVLLVGTTLIIAISVILYLIKKGFLHPKRANRLPDIALENTYHQHTEDMQSSTEQPDTLVYADIGPASLKKSKCIVTLSPDTLDDRVEYALLNHSVRKPIVEAGHHSVVDNSLNLDTLLIQIQGVVTSRWYQFGEALAVDRDVLDKCTKYSSEESIIEILDHWLRNFPGRPTWRDVAYALRKTNLHQLANDIEKVYETGRLPIEVGDDDGQQMFSISALELPQTKEEFEKMSDFNNYHQEESLPPLPPKPLAGSDESKKMKAPPRPPKYVPKS